LPPSRPQKKKIIARQRAYHGVTVATASLTGLAFAHGDFDLPIARILHTDCPYFYRGAQPGESEEAFAERLAASLEQMILREGPDTIAAFFAEPVMGAGGVITPPATYFDRVQPLLKKYDVLFVVDEVICGFGRTGNMFGSQTYNLEPDVMTLAKALSSGYLPISANLISNRLYEILLAQSDKLGIFGHGYTYSSHPVPAAVALETLNIYDERDIVGAVRRVGPRMQSAIRSYADHPLIGDARGIGLIGAVEIVRDKATKQSFDPKAGVAAYLVRRAQHHGAILRNMPGDIVAFSPPLIISEAEIDEMMACFGKALDDTWSMVRDKGLL
jgi:4-aminobutyrate--pyruvate transaminase